MDKFVARQNGVPIRHPENFHLNAKRVAFKLANEIHDSEDPSGLATNMERNIRLYGQRVIEEAEEHVLFFVQTEPTPGEGNNV